MSNFIEKLLPVAHQAADHAGRTLLGYFGKALQWDRKDAPSPIVSKADREAELGMRDIISGAFPDHNILGEEFGLKDNGSAITWVLDPLDGTIAFAMGKPTFMALLAVWEQKKPLIGIILQPLSNHKWVGLRETPATLDGKAIRVSGIKTLAEARFSTTDPFLFAKKADRTWVETLCQKAGMSSFGGDAYAYGLLAKGSIDLIAESGLGWHDVAALIPVIEGAGGVIRDFGGNKLTPTNKPLDVIAAATPELLKEALSLRKQP